MISVMGFNVEGKRWKEIRNAELITCVPLSHLLRHSPKSFAGNFLKDLGLVHFCGRKSF